MNFIDFWDFTPAESDAMLKIARDKFEYDTIQRGTLLMWIANAPHVSRRDQKPWELNDFLPDYAKHELTEEELERLWWNEAI